jgi:hypothetical protein
MQRVTIVNADTGEWRCNDPSCGLMQCWVCERDQKRDEKAAKAAKAADATKVTTKSTAAKPTKAKTDSWKKKKKANVAVCTAEDSNDAGDEPEGLNDTDAAAANALTAEPTAVSDEAAHEPEGGHGADGAPTNAQSAETAAASHGAQSSAGKQVVKTRWSHLNRMLVYKWVAARNPFSVQRGKTKETWEAIAEECKKSTKHLSVEEGKVDLSGHDIQVWVGKQLNPDSKFASWKKQLAQEASTSGQTGMLSNHETKEYEMLATIHDLKASAQTEKDAMNDAKKKSEAVKNCQMNDEIYAWAMASDVQRPQAFRTLNKKRKEIAIKMEAFKEVGARTKEEQLAKLSDADRDVLKYWEQCRQERQDTSTGADEYDSDENANRSGRKRRTLEQSMNAISKMGSSMAQIAATPTATETALQRYLEFKMNGGAARHCEQEQPLQGTTHIQNLQSRLKFLNDAHEQGIITKSEHAEQRKIIIAESFK